MLKVAYICEPQVGGTFVFFTQLRPHLARYGIDFRCIPPISGSAYANSSYSKVEGIDFLELSNEVPVALGQLIRHLEDQHFRAVLILPGCDPLGTSLPAYLPAHIGCAAKIPHNGRGTYLPTQEFEPYIDQIAPVNHLLAEDLIQRYGIPEEKVHVVFIGIDPIHFRYVERHPEPNRPLRLAVVGRLEDLQKNVLCLPAIVSETIKQGVQVHCMVAGQGPDANRLKKRIEEFGLESRFTLAGAVPYEQMPKLLQNSDVFLMPTRFEGCPHALLEGMSTGCVPVVSNLRGTLDQIVEHGRSGFLIKLGDVHGFAEAISFLAKNPEVRDQMSIQARQVVADRFTVASMAEAYATVLKQSIDNPSPLPLPRPMAQYRHPRSAAPTWRRWIPMPVKKIVRTLYGRLGRSI